MHTVVVREGPDSGEWKLKEWSEADCEAELFVVLIHIYLEGHIVALAREFERESVVRVKVLTVCHQKAGL